MASPQHARGRSHFIVLALVAALVAMPTVVSAADVEVKTTFLTALDNGGGYMEYRLAGAAASGLRALIDNTTHLFPFTTVPGDGDGTVDMAEADRYLNNLDDIYTRREIVLRGVKLQNVDVDDNQGLVGSSVNDTKELYVHITFRGKIQYDEWEFNLSGLEPLAALWGTYEDIPTTLTVDESTLIVAAGLANYEKRAKEGGTLLNLRVPMAAVVSWSGTYPVANPPQTRMEYTHSGILGNPIVLAILMLIFTYLAIKLPKAAARDNGKSRVRGLHLTILGIVILAWLFYFFGGPAILVWVLSLGCLAGIYYMSHLVYVKGWRDLAEDEEGLDLGEGLQAAKGETSRGAAAFVASQRPVPEEMAMQQSQQQPVVIDVQHGAPVSAPAYVAAQPPLAVQPPVFAPPPQPVAPPPLPVVPPPQPNGARPNGTNGKPLPPPPPPVKMRCPQCATVFQVPGAPRPLPIKCPGCGKQGLLR